MEKKPKKKIRSAKNKTDPFNHIINTALDLAEKRGWQGLLLNNIAEEAGLTLAELSKHFSSKTAILNGFQKRTNDAVLCSGIADGSSCRDQLFGILMHRFDILEPYRNSIRLIIRDVARDPFTALMQGPQIYSSMALMLEAVGVVTTGIEGALRVKGLILIYARALRIWLYDDSADFSETMSALDRDLTRAESMAGMLNKSHVIKKSPTDNNPI
jgi:AcrR family transcriptional regulator